MVKSGAVENVPDGFFRCGVCWAVAPEGKHVCGDSYTDASKPDTPKRRGPAERMLTAEELQRYLYQTAYSSYSRHKILNHIAALTPERAKAVARAERAITALREIAGKSYTRDDVVQAAWDMKEAARAALKELGEE